MEENEEPKKINLMAYINKDKVNLINESFNKLNDSLTLDQFIQVMLHFSEIKTEEEKLRYVENLIESFNEILIHNLELQKIFNEVEKPIEHKTQMNLKLTEEERKAKDELVLPFIKSEEEKKKDLDTNKINEDDNNEEEEIVEDPDDDLDV